MMNKPMRKAMKWSGEYLQMLKLAKKRGKGWARKHRERFFWLKKKVQEAERLCSAEGNQISSS